MLEETRDRFLPSWSEDKGRSGSSKNGSEEEAHHLEYSKDALQLVQLYHHRFPRVFHALNADGYKKLGTRDVCANDEDSTNCVCGCNNYEHTSCR